MRTARLVAGALAVNAAPAVTAIGPLRRRCAPGLSGVGAGDHIALTYDDGPDPTSTPAFLDLLARHGRRATFFVLAAQARAVPALVRRMVDEGHEVSVHGWTHRSAATFAPTGLGRRLRDAKHCVEDLTGAEVSWYRPPHGVLTTDALWACRELDLRPVLWTAWGRDWERSATPPRIVRSVLRTLRPGGTILLHDTDLHARGDWRTGLRASDDLLSGPLRDTAVGPLRDHACAVRRVAATARPGGSAAAAR